MRALLAALCILLAGCASDAPMGDDGASDPGGTGVGGAAATSGTGADPAPSPSPSPARPVLSSFGVTIGPYDPQTGLAGDLVFSDALLYDDGRIYNDRPFVDFGWTHDYYEQANIEYWFYVPLQTALEAPSSGQVRLDYLEHTDDWALHFDDGSGWTVSFEHVVDIVVSDGAWVEAGETVAHAAPRPGFSDELAMVELAVWHGGAAISKHCPADFLEPSLLEDHTARFQRLASDWEAFTGNDVYDEAAWVAPGCLVHSIEEA